MSLHLHLAIAFSLIGLFKVGWYLSMASKLSRELGVAIGWNGFRLYAVNVPPSDEDKVSMALEQAERVGGQHNALLIGAMFGSFLLHIAVRKALG